MKYKCRTCGKVVSPKNGVLSCCGITEYQDSCDAENRRHNRAVKREITKVVDRMFPEPIAHYNDETDDYDYEGLPNFD